MQGENLMNSEPTVKFITFGCKVNQYDTEALKDLFNCRGYRVVAGKAEIVDVVVINTCTVTHLADRKARQNIRKIKRNNPGTVIAVTGCYVQTDPEEVSALEEIDVVQGTSNRKELINLVDNIRGGRVQGQVSNVTAERPGGKYEPLTVKYFSYNNRSRHFLKIQEGCDQFCSYCIVPFARGTVRSRPSDSVLSEVNQALDAGFKELVLTGINLGSYGRENYDFPYLTNLLEKIISIPGEFRIRISSCEPQELTYELIDLIAESSKICSHLHIPLQSGDNEILAAMKRDYTTYEFMDIINRARSKDPDIAITTDVIVGFPGESESQFLNTESFITKVGFSDMHVFQYSPRKNTAAKDFPEQVHSTIKKERSSRLLQLTKELRTLFHSKFIGEFVPVLVESQSENTATGLTDTYIKTEFSTNKIVNNFNDIDLTGEMMDIFIEDYNSESLYGNMRKFE